MVDFDSSRNCYSLPDSLCVYEVYEDMEAFILLGSGELNNLTKYIY